MLRPDDRASRTRETRPAKKDSGGVSTERRSASGAITPRGNKPRSEKRGGRTQVMGQITGVAEAVTTSRVQTFGRRPKDAPPVDPAPPAGHGREGDRVELSETAKRAGGAGDTGVRMDLIERIRREIAAGTYESPEKLDIVAERIARVLDVQG